MPVATFYPPPAGSLKARVRAALECRETGLILIAYGLVVARLWISPLPSSFWIDETGTIWTIHGSLRDVIAHLHNYLLPQTPVFAFVMWGWAKIAGFSETALRIPSVAASIASMFGIYSLGKDLLNRSAALYAVLVLITLSHVDFAAADARPYAFASLCLIWAFYFRVRLAQTGSLLHAVLYGISCGLCFNLNYFFAAGLAADLLYLGIALRMGWVRWWKSLILSWLIALVLSLPLIPTLRTLIREFGLHVVEAGTPSWTDLGVALVPPRWIIAAIFGTAAALLLAGTHLAARLRGERSTLLMLSLWAFVPQFLIFVCSIASHRNVFVPRYLLGGAPGIALLGGYLLGSLSRPFGVSRSPEFWWLSRSVHKGSSSGLITISRTGAAHRP